jgi:hypothetical protein
VTPHTSSKGPHTKGVWGYDIPQAANRAAFEKVDQENPHLVRKISDTDRKSCPSSCPLPSECKGMESAVRRETYKQAVEERASAGMYVEFSLSTIPVVVFCMTSETSHLILIILLIRHRTTCN